MTLETHKLPRWAPKLAQSHPGYFKVVLALIGAHLFLGLDAIRLDPANSQIWTVIAAVFRHHFWALSFLHFVIVVLIITGLYVKDAFSLLRLGCGLSATLFNFLAVGLMFSAVDFRLSFALPIAFVALSLSSIAAAKEPEGGPLAL